MKVVAYIRLSSESKYEKGFGIDVQKQTCEEYAQRNGLAVWDYFIDDGYSGGLPYTRRPGMANALHNLRDMDILLVAKMDRVGRDPLDVFEISNIVERRGARLVSCCDEGTYSDDPSARFLKGITILLSENYRLEVSKKTKLALAKKKARGEKLGGYLPYGFKLASDGIHLEKCEEEQIIIKKLVELHNSGISFRKMPKVLEELGITNRGLKWTRCTIHNKVQEYRQKNG